MENNPWYYFVRKKLIKKHKPCIAGDQVHIKCWDGCYTVHSVHITYFTICKHRKMWRVPWIQFVCKRGEGRSPESILKKDIRYALGSIDLLSSNLNGIIKDLRK